jgi:phosphatidylinositol glycan class M
MVFLPFYLPQSSLVQHPKRGWTALGLWVIGQVSQPSATPQDITNVFKALWLQQAAALEFFGQSTFVPGLWLASLIFFSINCWILGVVVADVGDSTINDAVSGVKTQ